MPLFTTSEVDRRLTAMSEAVAEVGEALETLGKGSPWGSDVKASDDFLIPLFRTYFGKLGIPNLLEKKRFCELADYVPDHETDPGIGERLDAIAAVEKIAAPMADG